MTKQEFLNKKRVAIKRRRRRLWVKQNVINFLALGFAIMVMKGTEFSFFHAPSVFSAILLIAVGAYPLAFLLSGANSSLNRETI